MANRGTDPETIEQALTRLEDMLVDRYTDTDADVRQAAIAPAEVVKTTRVQLHSPLLNFGVDVPESDLRACCDSTILAGWPEYTQTPETRAKPST